MGYQITNLQQEINALRSGGGPEAVAAAEERAVELEKELEKMKHERDEAFLRIETSDKELNDVRSDLSEARRQLKEVGVTLPGFPWVTSRFSYSRSGQELHNFVVCGDGRL
ncbi:hypothetical protein BHM03_00001621 [Ensete ventricosum]|nr:hypothetical protein BHM03_00001621 [Ensete ventricosum]